MKLRRRPRLDPVWEEYRNENQFRGLGCALAVMSIVLLYALVGLLFVLWFF